MIPYRTVPEIAVGPLTVRVFGLALAAGIVVGAEILARHTRRRGVVADIGGLTAQLVAAGLVGARLAYVVGHAGAFAARPWAVLFVWEGGLQFAGAFTAGGFALWRWLRAQPVAVRGPVVSGLAIAVPAGVALGRLGCVAVGEHLGGPTSFFLATRYLGGRAIEGPLTPGVAIHNTALYEAIGLALLVVVLAWWQRRGPHPAQVAALAAGWYGGQRFLTDFARAADARMLGLTFAQVGALALALAAFIGWRRWSRRLPPTVEGFAVGGDVVRPCP